MKKRIACWALAGLALAPWTGTAVADVSEEAAFSDPGQIQTEAYILLAQADRNLDEQRFAEAAAGYRDALDLYEAIARDFPEYSPASIAYRIASCRNRLEALRDKMEPPPAVADVPAAAPASDADGDDGARASSRRITREEQEHAREVAFLREQLEALHDELAQADDERDALSRELATLRDDNIRLKAQLDARAEITVGELKQLRNDFEFAKTHVVSLQRDVDAAAELRAALDETEAREQALRAEIEELKAQLAEKDDELTTLELQLADSEARVRALEFQSLHSPPVSVDAAPVAPVEAPTVPEVPVVPDVPVASAPEPPVETAAAEPPPPSEPDWNLPPAYQPRGKARKIPAGTDAATFVRELLDNGENDAALLTLRRARADEPGDVNLALLEGVALIRVGAYLEAVDLLLPLAKANPKHAELHANLGAAMMGAGDYDEARATLEEAVRLDKRQGEAHFNLALLYANTPPVRPKLAAKHYKQALEYGVEPDPDLEAALP